MSINFTFRKSKADRIKIKNQLLFTEKIVEYVYSDKKDINAIEEYFSVIRKSLKKKKTSITFFSVIIQVQDNLEEDLSEKYKILFEYLNLKNRISSLLNSGKLSEQIIALKIIGCLKMYGYDKVITKCSVSRNYILRIVAIDTLLKLSKTDHLSLLLSHEPFISLLDINVIILGIEKNQKAEIDYLSLLESGSSRITSIGLLLIKSRNEYTYKENVKALLGSKNSFMNEIAWEVFMHFANTDEDLKFTMNAFYNESSFNKLQIIKGSGSFDMNDDLYKFLDKVIIEENLLLKIEALRVLFNKNLARFMSYEDSDDMNITAGRKEVIDLYLN